MLYALRYQKQAAGNIASLITTLKEQGVSPEETQVDAFQQEILITDSQPQLIYAVLNMSGADQRQDDLFSLENIFAKGRTALRGLKVGHVAR
jgi:hypothetical protein